MSSLMICSRLRSKLLSITIMLLSPVMLVPLRAGITDPCLSVKIPLADRIESARHVIYGTVVSQRVTWDDARRSIYTINRVVVHDVWKSTSALGDTINVLTEGGDMGTMGRTVVGTLKLEVGDVGYLILEQPRAGDVTFIRDGVGAFHRPYAEVQALLISASNDQIRDCWGETGLTTSAFEQRNLGHLNHMVRSPRPAAALNHRGGIKEDSGTQGTVAFTPKRAIGGMGEAITIMGSGFGAERGTSYVTFTSDGTNYHGADYAKGFAYRSWSDSEIIVEVPPSYSNKVRVVVGATVYESADTLRVTSNLAARSLSPLSYTNLININGQGGYTWSIDKALFDIPEAKQCVESVMRQFRCRTGVMFDVSATPTTAGYALNDGINAIIFDAPGYELGAGAVAYCDWIWYSCIVGTETFYYVRDFDCRLSRKFSWFYGNGKNPEFGMAKLRYVLYHEIGHAHQFGHVNEWGESMHPVVQALPAEEWLARDTITTSERRAGAYMTTLGRTFAFRGCGVQPLAAPANTDCNSDATSSVGSTNFGGTLQLNAYPNPASTVITLSSNEHRPDEINIDIYDMLGTRVSSTVLPSGTEEVSTDLPMVAPGNYVVRATLKGDVIFVGSVTVTR